MTPRIAVSATLGLLSLACAPAAPTPDAGTVRLLPSCSDAGGQAIHFGAGETRLPLTPEQASAVARVDLGTPCSGMVVAPRWVLTARHCVTEASTRRVLVGFGEIPDVQIDVARTVSHDVVDLALVELAVEARTAMPGLEPVPIVPFALPPLVGALAEAAGFGEREDGESGARRFFAAPIAEVIGDAVVIDGMQRGGTCFGDSGGPLFVSGAGGVRVAGVLSEGDPSCVGRSRFTRLDTVRAWIESYVGPTPPDEPACGDVTSAGLCRGSSALRCAEEVLRIEVCDLGETCSSVAGTATCMPLCPR